MKRYEISLPSSDGKTTLHGYHWKPEGEVRAVVQLVHGMEEYIGRYDEFACFLAGQGIAVIGHDHLGHGGSVTDESELGYFAKDKGVEGVLRDMFAVTQLAKKEYPDRPIFMFAHSMGSFFARRFITVYPRELAGVILSGTGSQPYIAVHIGKQLSRLIAKFKGDHYRSRLVENLAVGGYGSVEKWLCTREEIVEAYKADPLCGFPFTVWAYKDFFKTLEYLALGKDQDRIPKDFPILLMAGMLDPVGGKSKGVLQVYNHYKKIGLIDVDVFLYKDDMHEILNETDRDDVYHDALRWLDKRIDNLKTT